MDELGRFNQQRWDELARAGVEYSQPSLDLTATSARRMVDPESVMGDPAGRDVLCLAGGGGQQSAAFALLGANVTVLDFSETQLERDREAARHYGHQVETVLGDMRDLTCFADDSFDIVWHAHSLGFVPDAQPVLDEVGRVIRPGGLYRVTWPNPLCHGTFEQWTGSGYLLSALFAEGAEVFGPDWEVAGRSIPGPREFRHTLGCVTGHLRRLGFVTLGVREDADRADPRAEPGSWQHFCAIAPPWLVLWAAYRPDALRPGSL